MQRAPFTLPCSQGESSTDCGPDLEGTSDTKKGLSVKKPLVTDLEPTVRTE